MMLTSQTGCQVCNEERHSLGGDVGAGDQSMLWYRSDGYSFGKEIDRFRWSGCSRRRFLYGELWWLRPDGFDNIQRSDGSVERGHAHIPH